MLHRDPNFMSTPPQIEPRRALRERLHALRDQAAASADHRQAEAAMARHLAEALEQLAPDRLGVYWPTRSEFNAAAACLGNEGLRELPFALPFARRTPRTMDYRAWDRQTPTLRDECGLASVDGPVVVPDVVLAPCLGFTVDGYRVGYGGGYFDRWLAAHPHVTAIGIAWNATEIDASEFGRQAHDLPMMMVITERGIVAS